jgi:hypothetical protein
MGWVESVTLRPRFAPGTHRTGGWVGHRARLDTEARGKILSSLPGIEPRLPGRTVRSQTLHWLSYPGSRSNSNSIYCKSTNLDVLAIEFIGCYFHCTRWDRQDIGPQKTTAVLLVRESQPLWTVAVIKFEIFLSHWDIIKTEYINTSGAGIAQSV